MINAFGGRWFDENWNAQLDSPEVKEAVKFYVDTVRQYGEPGAASTGFQECANLMSQGQVAMWYDATSAVSVLESPDDSNIAGNVGYALAPSMAKGDNGWLYAWSLGIPESSKKKDDAWKFIDLDDQQGLHQDGGGPARCRQRPAGQPVVHLRDSRPTRRSPALSRSRR